MVVLIAGRPCDSRKDFGLVWNSVLETGGVAVGDEVKITLDLRLQLQLQLQRKP